MSSHTVKELQSLFLRARYLDRRNVLSRVHLLQPTVFHTAQQLLSPAQQYNKVLYIYSFVVPFTHPRVLSVLPRLLLTLLILSFLPLLTPWHPRPPFSIAQLYRCHRLPLLLKHELLGKLNSSGSWREKVCGRHVVVMMGAWEGGGDGKELDREKVKLQGSPKHMCQSLATTDNSRGQDRSRGLTV